MSSWRNLWKGWWVATVVGIFKNFLLEADVVRQHRVRRWGGGHRLPWRVEAGIERRARTRERERWLHFHEQDSNSLRMS
eukprot:scaffold30434_cov29-Tisochrysis_lutea.AAC.3